MRELLQELGLDWPLTPDSLRTHGRIRDAVIGIVAPGGDDCLLISAQQGEFGIGGEARFCLIDPRGHILWKRELVDNLLGMPALSTSGVTALLVRGERDFQLPSLVVHFVTREGMIAGSTAWGHRVSRPHQRAGLQEVYGFSPNGLFVISVNQSEGDTSEINSTHFYCVDPDGTISWDRDLGAFDPNELAFSKDGDRIVLDNLRRGSSPPAPDEPPRALPGSGFPVGYENQVYILDSGGNEVSHHVVRGNRGASGSCLDGDSGKLYLDDGELCAVDVMTGRMERSVSPAPLFKLAESESPAMRDAANRLIARFQK